MTWLTYCFWRAVLELAKRLCKHHVRDWTTSPHDDGAFVTGECRQCHAVTDRKFVPHSDPAIARAAAQAYALCRTAGMSHVEAEAIAQARARRAEWEQIAAAFKAFNADDQA